MVELIKKYVNKKDWKETFVVFFVTLSLYFTFTNYVFISAIATVILIFFLPFAIQRDIKIKSVVGYLFLIFVYFAVSALIVQPKQLIDFEFYRRDGNVFITFAPLLVLGICKYEFNLKKIVSNFVLIATVANVVGIARFFIFKDSPEYFMFFSAHNAAGGFLSMVVVFNIYVISARKYNKWIFTVCLFINLIGLYLTDSRGSILPLILAFMFVFIEKRIRNIEIIAFVVAFLCLFFVVAYIAVVRGYDVFVVKTSFDLPKEFANSEVINKVFSFNRSYTAIDRLFYLWPRAAQMFLYSPIFGAGMGTFNDEINFIGQKGLIYLNVGSEYYSASNHAHNSFLHILAENGLFGMLLVILFLWEIRKFAKKLEDKKLGNAIITALFYAILSGFLEHRLFTPAQMIPFVLILGMAISNANYHRHECLLNKTEKLVIKSEKIEM